jgi:hypothetical protein
LNVNLFLGDSRWRPEWEVQKKKGMTFDIHTAVFLIRSLSGRPRRTCLYTGWDSFQGINWVRSSGKK